MGNFTVVYDACLLYPASIRDLTVELARVGLLHFAGFRLVSKDDIDPWGLSDFYPLSVFKFRTPQALQLLWAVVFEGTFVALFLKLTRAVVPVGRQALSKVIPRTAGRRG